MNPGSDAETNKDKNEWSCSLFMRSDFTAPHLNDIESCGLFATDLRGD